MNIEFVNAQRKAAGGSSRIEAIPETNFEKADHYKVVYRSVAVLLRPPCEEVLMPKRALQWLIEAHPYFSWLFQDSYQISQFEITYNFTFEAFND